ncbi:MAG: MipA/OmpV family protein [Pontixanthobacter sp.]
MTKLTILRTMAPFAGALALLTQPVAAGAQDGDTPRRTRVALGPQLVPSFPGADEVVLRPLFDFSRAEAGEEFAFEAPDESFGFSLYNDDRFAIGPAVGFEGERASEDVGGRLPEVDFTVELGAFARYQASENFRLRGEVRYGVTGHEGVIAVLGGDYVMRDGDRQLISIGPRVTLTDASYQNAYFGVAPQDAIASGLPAFDADGGVQAVGGTVGYIQQFSPRWGIYSYAKYDRLVGDAADSPVVRQFGSRDQLSGGIALTYTFGSGLD